MDDWHETDCKALILSLQQESQVHKQLYASRVPKELDKLVLLCTSDNRKIGGWQRKDLPFVLFCFFRIRKEKNLWDMFISAKATYLGKGLVILVGLRIS